MNYQHRFTVNAIVEEVAEFHNQTATMAAITPPPILVQVHRSPERLADGEQMDFTLWFGPLPLHWLVQFEEVGPTGFVDRMLTGPLRRWRHRHQFVAINSQTTAVVDDIDLQVRPHLIWGPVGLGFRLGLPLLFAFRAWKTRRLLRKPAMQPDEVSGDNQESRNAWIIAGGAVLAGLLLLAWRRIGKQNGKYIQIN